MSILLVVHLLSEMPLQLVGFDSQLHPPVRMLLVLLTINDTFLLGHHTVPTKTSVLGGHLVDQNSICRFIRPKLLPIVASIGPVPNPVARGQNQLGLVRRNDQSASRGMVWMRFSVLSGMPCKRNNLSHPLSPAPTSSSARSLVSASSSST
jgi:hypothetical protein